MKRLFFTVLFVIILTSPLYPGQRLNIFYQNDLHGWFFPSAQEAGLPKVLEILKGENQKGPPNFYVVAGDILTGPLLPEDKKGRAELEVWGLYQRELDQIGFRDRHILSLGNHEFDYGFPEILKELNPICANIVNEKNEPYFRPFTIAKERGISVSFLGLIMDDYPKVNSVLKEKGLRVEDMKGSIKKYEPSICKADIAALVIHDNISDIKDLVEGLSNDSCIDIVITGHTHITTENPIYIKGKPMVQAGSMNQYLGKLELEYEEGKVKVVQNQLIPLFPDRFTYELMNFKEMVSEQKGNSIALVRSSLYKPKGRIPNE
ncbi:MAG: metallophosphoesterase, partial [Desulfatiglandales bacterium]